VGAQKGPHRSLGFAFGYWFQTRRKRYYCSQIAQLARNAPGSDPVCRGLRRKPYWKRFGSGLKKPNG
jgi:hypothetical protein